MAFALFNAVLDLVFPPRCAHCGAYLARDRALCAGCRRRIILHKTFFCGKCRARRYSARGICHKNFPFLLAAAGSYEDPALRALIRSLKFGFVRSAAAPLGAIMADYARRLGIPRQGYDAVVPVPLSQRRLRERGFNQAELIAREAGRALGIPVEPGLLRRRRHAPPQSGLPGDARRRARNIAGCFEIAAPAAVAGRRIILLDDVVTTGATMREAAAILKAAGAKDILALAAAKT